MQAVIDSDSKVHAMKRTLAKELGLRICKTHIDTYKINSSRLETFDIIIALLQVNGKDRKFYFFEETFLLVDISMDFVFRIRFLIFTNVKVNFND